jgi:hypothetical protein
LGSVPHGETVAKKFVVRGKKPFRILKVEGESEQFQFKNGEAQSQTHIVEVVFAAKSEPGQVKQDFQILTDMGDSYQAKLTAYATIVAPGSTSGPTEVRTNAASAGTASVVGQ